MGPTGFGVTTPSSGIKENELWKWTGPRVNISSDSDQFERRVKKVHTMVKRQDSLLYIVQEL